MSKEIEKQFTIKRVLNGLVSDIEASKDDIDYLYNEFKSMAVGTSNVFTERPELMVTLSSLKLNFEKISIDVNTLVKLNKGVSYH